jgi:ribosome biogenesis protein BMS1
VISKALQKGLPYSAKPKTEEKKKGSVLDKRPKVILEPQERREQKVIQMLNTIKNNKIKKKREKQKEKSAKYKKDKVKKDAKVHEKEKEKKKRYHAKQSMIQVSKTKRQKRA